MTNKRHCARKQLANYRVVDQGLPAGQSKNFTRATWCKSKSTNWLDEIVGKILDDNKSVKSFRMGKLICDELQPHSVRKDTMIKSISFRGRVAVAISSTRCSCTFLRRSSNADYTIIVHLMGISPARECDRIDKFFSCIHYLDAKVCQNPYRLSPGQNYARDKK